MRCEHVAGAVCWLCSDQDPRWFEWRSRALVNGQLRWEDLKMHIRFHQRNYEEERMGFPAHARTPA